MKRKRKIARNWLELPAEVMSTIMLKLGAIEILTSAQFVCSSWNKICKDPSMWRVIDMHNLGDLHDMEYNLEIMCMHAVFRSHGQLVDINIEYFGTDDLLRYITRRYLLTEINLNPCVVAVIISNVLFLF